MAQLRIQRAATDPICPRISLGGDVKIGFYLTYRGTRDQVIECLETALTGIKALNMEIPITDPRPMAGPTIVQGRS